MIEDSPVVNDIRQIRQAISKRFDHDPDRYIDYLRSMEQTRQAVAMNKLETAENLPFPQTIDMKLEAPGQTQG
jgi:hypothetical protein